MAIRILVDSASDITQEQAKELNIRVLPLLVRFGDEEYQDGVTMGHDEFFEKLIETDLFPTTSQLAPYVFEKEYEDAKQAGDQVLYLAVSGKLSGCVNSARIAAEDYEDMVSVLDTENVCIGQYILAERAVKLRAEGKTLQEITDILNIEKKKIRLIALLDTLEYLKKGGRISATVAFAGSLLSIKPVVEVKDGLVELVGKARGSKNGNNLLTKMVENSGGINFEYPYRLGYSGLSDKLLQKYIKDSEALYKDNVDHLPVSSIGCIIGTHAGPGAIALAFFEK